MKKAWALLSLFVLSAAGPLAAGDSGPWRDYGGKLMQARRPAEALQAYRRALSLDPQDAAAWAGAGNAQWGLGRKEEALRSWRASLKLRPGNQPLADFVAKVSRTAAPTAALGASPSGRASASHADSQGGSWLGHGMKGLFLGLGLAVVALF